MKADKLLLELETVLEQAGYTLRKERGAFRGSECIVSGDKIVVVNKNKPVESQVATIARVLSEIELDDIYVKPAIKKELGLLWERLTIVPNSYADELDLE